MTTAQPLFSANVQGENNFIEILDTAGTRWRLAATVNGLTFSDQAGNPVGSSLMKVAAKTADYTIVAADLGTLFTNRGASGAVNFTLPVTAASVLPTGWHCQVFTAVLAQTVTVTSATTDTMTVFNDLTADSIAFSTSSEMAGNGLRFVWDGTGWLTFVMLGTETATPTIAT